MAPARILACQSPHERSHLSREGRAPALAGRLSPLPPHECAMPAQQRPRSDQARAARGAWQVGRRRRQQGTIGGTKVRPRHLAAQDLELVAKDEQLDVLDVQTAATADERSQQRPEREVEKREGHGLRSSQPAPRRPRHEYWRPSGARRRVVVPDSGATPSLCLAMFLGVQRVWLARAHEVWRHENSAEP